MPHRKTGQFTCYRTGQIICYSHSILATSYDQQIAILRQRGMRVDDEDAAKFYLQHLNYYRLGAYWLPFEKVIILISFIRAPDSRMR